MFSERNASVRFCEIQESDRSSHCVTVGLYCHAQCRTLEEEASLWWFLLKCELQLNIFCHVVTWNAATLSPFCLSVVLTLDVLKKQSLDWRRLESHCHDSFEMDVGVSRSHVFLNCSPRALFSQWDTHLHGGAAWSQYSLLLAYLHLILFPCLSRSFSSVKWKASERIWCKYSVVSWLAGGGQNTVNCIQCVQQQLPVLYVLLAASGQMLCAFIGGTVLCGYVQYTLNVSAFMGLYCVYVTACACVFFVVEWATILQEI